MAQKKTRRSRFKMLKEESRENKDSSAQEHVNEWEEYKTIEKVIDEAKKLTFLTFSTNVPLAIANSVKNIFYLSDRQKKQMRMHFQGLRKCYRAKYKADGLTTEEKESCTEKFRGNLVMLITTTVKIITTEKSAELFDNKELIVLQTFN